MSSSVRRRARPDQVKKVLETVQQQGPLTAYKKAMNRLDSYSPLGYSLAGVVLEVGRGPRSSRSASLWRAPGTSTLSMPRSTGCRPISAWRCPTGSRPSWRRSPRGLDRPAGSSPGERTDRGHRVRDRPWSGRSAGRPAAGGLGGAGGRTRSRRGPVPAGGEGRRPPCAPPTDEGVAAAERALARASGGLGADRIFLVSGGSSNQPVSWPPGSHAIGRRWWTSERCSLDLPWNDYYEKELDLRFSRSYGPGRYDPPLRGRRNRLPPRLRALDRASQSPLLRQRSGHEGDRPPTADCRDLQPRGGPNVYEQLNNGSLQGVGFLFEYDAPAEGDPAAVRSAPGRTQPAPDHDAAASSRRAAVSRHVRGTGALRVGFVGAGTTHRRCLLPHLAKHPEVELVRVATTPIALCGQRRSASSGSRRRAPTRTL